MSLMKIGVIGAGAMGAGIAQVAAQNGHDVVLYDTKYAALERARHSYEKIFARLVEKGNGVRRRRKTFSIKFILKTT